MSNFMTKCLSVMALTFFGFAASAEDRGDELVVSCGGVFGFCGYSSPDGQLLVPRDFESLRRFSNQLAAARQAGLWGFLSPDGEFEIEPVFDLVGNFHNDRAEVVLNGKAGVIDRDGNFVIPAEFWRAIPFGRNAALVARSNYSRHTHRRLEHNSLAGKFEIFNTEKGAVTRESNHFRWFVRPGKDGPTDRIWSSLDGQTFGLIDDTGNWLVEPQYDNVQPLYEGRAIVAVRDASGDRLWGAVDSDGQIAIPLSHHRLSFFENGYGLVIGPGHYKERKTGLIDHDGTVLGNQLFEKVERPDDLPPRVMKDGIWYNFAKDGSLVREEPDGTIIGSCPQGLTIARDGPGYAVTNRVGQRELVERVDRISFGIAENGSITGRSINRREIDCRGPIPVGRGPLDESEWTYVRPDGSPLIPGVWFSNTYRFSAGHAIIEMTTKSRFKSRFKNKELWGILNERGEYTLPFGRERVSRRSNMFLPDGQPYFLLGKGQNQRPVDKFGHPVQLLDSINDNQRARAVTCSGGARIVADRSGFGIEGPDGATLVPPIHRAMNCYRNGVAWAPKEDLKLWCPIGPDGAFRSQPACIERYYPYSVTHHYPETFADDPFESNILWVRAWLDWGMDRRDDPPEWIGDGVMSQSSYSIRSFGGQ